MNKSCLQIVPKLQDEKYFCILDNQHLIKYNLTFFVTPYFCALQALLEVSLLLFPCPLPLLSFLLFHKHIALMGPEGLWGYAISSHINKPTAAHNMHTFFPPYFSFYVYFYSLTQYKCLGSSWPEPEFQSLLWEKQYCFPWSSPVCAGQQFYRESTLITGCSFKEEKELA